MSVLRVSIFTVLLTAICAEAASRPRFGGSLKIATTSRVESNPLWCDTPSCAAVLSLSLQPLCRLKRASPSSRAPASPLLLHTARGAELSKMLKRVAAAPSPYRALLAPLSDEKINGEEVELSLAFAYPELEAVLCHPAFAFTAGPFTSDLAANAAFPAGRPFVDSVNLTVTDARGADRLLAQHRVQLTLGASGAPLNAPQQFATYLVVSNVLPDLSGFHAAIEASVDRLDLTRFFVRAPSTPLRSILPDGAALDLAGPPPKALIPPRSLALLFDAGLDDQRAVAERLQVKLHAFGYQVALKPMPREQLQGRWAAHDYQLMLQSVLLPPQPAPATALALELGEGHATSTAFLKDLASAPDEKDRAARIAEGAKKAAAHLIPLYTQGLSIQSSGIEGLELDAFGLPLLDNVFLARP